MCHGIRIFKVHIVIQAMRSNKTSAHARDKTHPEDYDFILKENVFDMLLFHIVRRIYLERLAETILTPH
jgi:hypothetical protein